MTAVGSTPSLPIAPPLPPLSDGERNWIILILTVDLTVTACIVAIVAHIIYSLLHPDYFPGDSSSLNDEDLPSLDPPVTPAGSYTIVKRQLTIHGTPPPTFDELAPQGSYQDILDALQQAECPTDLYKAIKGLPLKKEYSLTDQEVELTLLKALEQEQDKQYFDLLIATGKLHLERYAEENPNADWITIRIILLPKTSLPELLKNISVKTIQQIKDAITILTKQALKELKEKKDCAICRMEDLHQILKENLEDDPQSPNHEVLEALYEMRTKIALKYPVTRENDDDDLMSFIGPIAELMRQLNISLYTLNLRVSFHRLTLLAERHSLDVSQLFSTEELDEDFANRFVRSQYAHARKLTLSTKSKLEAGLEIPSSIELEQVQQEKMQFMNFIDQAQLEIHWIVFSIDKIDSRKEITKEERQKRAKLQRIQDEIAKLEQSVQTLQAQLVEPKSIGEVLALLEKRGIFQRAANELIRKRVACFGTTTCVLHPQATAILKRWEVK